MTDETNKNNKISSSNTDDEAQNLLGTAAAYNSYQNNAPTVHQLDDVLPERHAWYGDATLEPNTGRTNSYDYALFGLALHEILDRLRLSIIVNSLLMFLFIFFTWWIHLFRPFRLILSLVIGALALVLLVVEVSSILNPQGAATAVNSSSSSIDTGTDGSDSSSSNRQSYYEAKLKQFLRFTERLGLLVLYHPIGKTIYLSVCGVLCCVVGGVSYLLGALFFLNAAVLLYCWLTYPEFRRTFEREEGAPLAGASANRGPGSRAMWSEYSSDLYEQVNEKVPKLSAALRK